MPSVFDSIMIGSALEGPSATHRDINDWLDNRRAVGDAMRRADEKAALVDKTDLVAKQQIHAERVEIFAQETARHELGGVIRKLVPGHPLGSDENTDSMEYDRQEKAFFDPSVIVRTFHPNDSLPEGIYHGKTEDGRIIQEKLTS